MKKEVFKIIGLSILISIPIVVILIIFLNHLYNDDFNKFTYQSSKEIVTTFLNKNKKELEKIADEVQKSKVSKKDPLKNISYVSYYDEEYIQFNMDAQGMLGGQYYGLIYSINDNITNNEKIKIYDEYKETGSGNNIIIREKICDNWYFYYEDYDGKVDTSKIK